tara:strand:- start:10915 stop:11550 length:636 start_codon:yes stop_codon:yes gene_type:complete
MIRSFIRVAALLCIPFSIPASSTEVGSLWQPTAIFHKQITNKTCATIPANKLHRVPGYKFTYQQTDDCDYFYPSHTSLAMHVFYVEWMNKFGDNDGLLLSALNELIIEYGTYQRLVARIYGMDGDFRAGQSVVNGLTGNRGKYIFVWIGKGSHPKLAKTSFVHELVHVAIYAANFGEHGDPDHLGDKYKGWTHMHTKFIEDTNEILKSMDL